jgi:hypothetical protein
VTTEIEILESDYFGEEDLMDMQDRLVRNGIDLKDCGISSPVLFAKALDILVNGLVAGITEYPEEMLFGVCNGNHSSEFEAAIKQARTTLVGEES